MLGNDSRLAGILATAFGLMLAGCAGPQSGPLVDKDLSSSITGMQHLYGPPWPIRLEFVSDPLSIDLDGDGHPEVMVVFGDDGMDRPTISTENTETNPVICREFLVLTEVEGRWWPLFYFYNGYRAAVQLRKTGDGFGIVVSGNWDGQYTWGWRSDGGDWGPTWDARHREWDSAKSEWGPWKDMDRLFAIYGK